MPDWVAYLIFISTLLIVGAFSFAILHIAREYPGLIARAIVYRLTHQDPLAKEWPCPSGSKSSPSPEASAEE